MTNRYMALFKHLGNGVRLCMKSEPPQDKILNVSGISVHVQEIKRNDKTANDHYVARGVKGIPGNFWASRPTILVFAFLPIRDILWRARATLKRSFTKRMAQFTPMEG